MDLIGRVDSVWRYPVKGMQGERLERGYLGYAGFLGDRCFAIHDHNAAKGFPFFTAQQQARMILYRPRFRYPELFAEPSNLRETEKIGPGLTPLYPELDGAQVDVETPEGDLLQLEDPALLARLTEGTHRKANLTWLRSCRSMTDCRPLSLFSLQTIEALGRELERSVEPQRFRANLYIDLHRTKGFGEEALLGTHLRIGSRVIVAVVHRDVRCKVITLDPKTGEADPDIIRYLARTHEGAAGVYGVVLEAGMVCEGDDILVC